MGKTKRKLNPAMLKQQEIIKLAAGIRKKEGIGLKEAYYKAKKELEKKNPYKHALYEHERVASPSEFDPGSFRTKTIKPGVKITMGCPKGEYSTAGKCKVGTKAQRILKAKNVKCGKKNFSLFGGGGNKTYYVGIPYNGRGVHYATTKPLEYSRYPNHQWFKVTAGTQREAVNKAIQLRSGSIVPHKFKVRAAKRVLKAARHSIMKNPASPLDASMVRIYDRALEIHAQKGKDSNYPNEQFVHNWEDKTTEIFGLPKGTVISLPDGDSYELKSRSILMDNKKGHDLYDVFQQ